MNIVYAGAILGKLMEPISWLIAVGCVLGLASATRKSFLVVIVGTVLLALLKETLGYKEAGVVWGDKLLLNGLVALVQIIVVTFVVMRIKKRKAKKSTNV